MDIQAKFKSGMTLVEVLVTTGLLSILSLLMAVLLAQGVKSNRVGQQTIKSQDASAKVMREFEYSARAATQVVKANASAFTFYRFYNQSDSYPTQVHYFVNGSQFIVGRTLPQGIAPDITYPENGEEVVFLIDDLTNPTAIFQYFDGNGDEVLPSTDPAVLASITMVKLTISVDSNGSSRPGPVTATTTVNLRNEKKNL